MRLGELWGCHWRDARDRCDSADLEIYKAYYRLEPWGGRADDVRAGVVAATVFNFGGMVVPKRALGADDFFPSLKPPAKPPQPMTTAELLAFAKRETALMGGKVG